MATVSERSALLERIRAALEPEDDVRALWEGGSAAFQRNDAWSDIDAYALVRDGCRAEVLDRVEAELAALGPFDLCWSPPSLLFAHASQRFWHTSGTPPELYVDVLVVERAGLAPLLVRDVHGEPRVLFDKDGAICTTALDRTGLAARVSTERENLDRAWPLFVRVVAKELGRGNLLGALGFWHTALLPRLNRRLRLVRCPERSDWGLHYARFDLEPSLAAELLDLALVQSAQDLGAKLERAQALYARECAR